MLSLEDSASSVSDDSYFDFPPLHLLIRNACMIDFRARFVALSSESSPGLYSSSVDNLSVYSNSNRSTSSKSL